MDKNCTVHVVDDDRAVREGIAGFVEDMGLEARTYSSAEEFLESYVRSGVDCLVLDMRMAGMSGMDLLKKLSEERRYIPTVVVTGHGDISMAVETLKNGAVDFVEKPFREQALWESIQKALKVGTDYTRRRLERERVNDKIAILTDRERAVLGFLLEGKSDKQIALEIGVTRRAVAFHRNSVLNKFEAGNIVELANLIAKGDVSV